MWRVFRLCAPLVVLALLGVLIALPLWAGPLEQHPRPPKEWEQEVLGSLPRFPLADDAIAPLSTWSDYLPPSLPNHMEQWSKLTFQSYRDGNWEIYSANGDGSGATRLSARNSSDIQPRANRGVTRIAFASNRTGNYEIFTINPDGSVGRQLTFTPANEFNPVWSSDGTMIAFSSYRDGNSEIYVMNADGSGQTRLTNSAAYDGDPSWSPDGTKIAFISDRASLSGTGTRIWVMNSDGSNQLQLSTQPFSENPVWSPDGAHIAYDADGNNDGWQDIWTMNADGSGQVKEHDALNSETQGDDWVRSWSPDGRYIAFTRISLILYNGHWYWNTAYLDAWDTQQAKVIRLSSQGKDWSPDWQTSDVTPPSSSVNALPRYSRAYSTTVYWSGTDAGAAGIASYDIQYRNGEAGNWVDWLTNTPDTSATFSASGGPTTYFRSRARDRASNVEAWPMGKDGDAVTKLFAWLLSGRVFDSRAIRQPRPEIAVQPPQVGPILVDGQGDYMVRLAQSGQNQVGITEPGQGSITDAVPYIDHDLTVDIYLPPTDNFIRNGNFEANKEQVVGWIVSGNSPPTVTTEVKYTGQAAAFLQSIEPHFASPERIPGGIGSQPDVAVSDDGTVHLTYIQETTVFYISRSPQGVWSAPVAIGTQAQSPVIAVTSDGGVHLVWSGLEEAPGIYYSHRNSDGTWTVPQTVDDSGKQPDLAVDSQDGLHLIYNRLNNYGWYMLYYTYHPSSGGIWTTPEEVFEGSGQGSIAIGLHDTVQIMASKWSYVYYCRRLGEGWGCSSIMYGFHPRTVVDSEGALHVVVSGHYAVMPPDGWFQVSDLSDLNGYGDLALDNAGNVYIINTSGPANQGHTYFRYRTAKGVWSSPLMINTHNWGWPRIVVDQAGRFHIVYEGESTANYYHTNVLPPDARSQLGQTVTLVSDMHKPTLSFLYRLQGIGSHNDDRFSVHISNGVTSTVAFSRTENTDSWTQAWVDLSSWAGQKVTITVMAKTSEYPGETLVYLDDVSLGSWLTPVISDVYPSHIEAWTSTPITVTGDNFIAIPPNASYVEGPALRLNYAILPNVHWLNESTMTAVIPALPAGTYEVGVANPGGQESTLPTNLVVGEQVYLPILRR